MKKLKNESGSALLFALLLMILVSILIVSFSNQVANQIRSTINLDEDIQEIYSVESDIEECIKDFIEGIEIEYKDDKYIKETENTEGNNIIKYKKYIYYNINYNIKFSKTTNYEIELINDIKNDENKVVRIFSETKNVSEINSSDKIIDENDVESEFDSMDISKGITFRMSLLEKKYNKKSEIIIKIDDIKGEKEKETYRIDYSVESWRERIGS